MRVEKIKIMTALDRYVADDGTIFEIEKECKKYEEAKEREKRLNAIDKFRVKELYDLIPLNYSAEFSEFWSYTWFKFNNEDEEKEFEEAMETVVDAGTEYPKYFCIESEDEFDDCANISDWSHNVEGSMNIAKSYFNAFGIDVEFKRREVS